jgi:hypothetical protein
MQALKDISWLLWLLVTAAIVFETIGWRGLVRMFPEARRWWQLPAQLASLAAFAAVVLFHPF